MTFYEFFHSLGFWQWVGILMIAAIMGATLHDIADTITRNLRK